MPPSKRPMPRPAASLSGALGQKQFDSETISTHLATFLRDGGRIEKLGTTRVLHKIDGSEPPAKPRR